MSIVLRHAARLLLVAATISVLGACGGDGGARPPATPAGAVDPTADGAVTGPINRARQVAGDQQQRDATLEQPSLGQP